MYDAIRLQVSKLLNKHLLRGERDSAFQLREAHDASIEQMKDDHHLPSALKQFEGLFRCVC